MLKLSALIPVKASRSDKKNSTQGRKEVDRQKISEEQVIAAESYVVHFAHIMFL